MSGSQQLLLGGVPTVPAVDPYFYSVTSLLHGDGTNGGQNNTFLDSSSNNFTITRNGNTTQGSFSPFSQTGWSNYFDGSGDYLSIPSAVSTFQGIGANNFSYECFVYPLRQTNTYGQALISYGLAGDLGSSTCDLVINASGYFQLAYATGSAPTLLSPALAAVNQWSHIVVCRSGSTLSMFVNGIRVATASTSATVGSSGNVVYIGNQWYAVEAARQLQGYISNARVLIGSSAYDATSTTITVPITPLTAITNTKLLTCQSNRFIDNSSNAFAITANGDTSVQPFSPFNPTTAYSTSAVGGSGYFDGSGDYLEAASNSAFTLGSTGDFTVECWVYPTAATGNYAAFLTTWAGADTAGNYDNRWWLGTNADGIIRWYDSAGSPAIFDSVAITRNAWTHVAVVRSGSTITLYKNGLSLGTQTTNQAYTTQGALKSGFAGSNSNYFVGYIASARVVKGTAVYTSTFTPPTAPLTAITNTSLLLNYTNGAIFDNAAVADYETVGNAQISTSVKKYGTGSMYFDGTGDALAAADSVNQEFGSGDFTIEAWIYTTNAGTRQTICAKTDSGGIDANSSFIWQIGTSGSPGSGLLNFYHPAASSFVTASTALASNTWYHVAICRIGSVFKQYINGTENGTLTSSTAIRDVAQPLYIGGALYGVGFNGYIDDFRISKGIARYPYNFTPPTAEFPNIGGTVTLTADPYFDYTTLLLPGNGTNGAQNNTFLDSSTNAFSITRNGNTTQGTFSPFSQTGWGAYFDGTGDYLSVSDAAAFTLGTSDFCMESWVYPVNAGTGASESILGQWSSASYGWIFQYRSNKLLMYYSTNGSSTTNAIDATATIVNNAWNHIAFVRSGNTLSAYVNGVRVSTNASFTASIVNSSSTVNVGRNGDNSEYVTGYLSNTRLVVGSSVYDPTQASFTVPTSPLTAITNTSLLTCQSNRFIDNSSNAFAITRNGDVSVQAFSPFNPTAAWSAATYGGSGYFDGSGDTLSLADDNALDLGTGDFSIEGWVYLTGFPGSGANAFVSKFASGNYAYLVQIISASTLRFYTGNSGSLSSYYDYTYTWVLNQWTHIAITRESGTLRAFVNGTLLGSNASVTQNLTNTSTLIIGNNGDGGGQDFNGYISSLRIVKGSAVYTAAFTPPTAPVTAITNTSLLLNFTNAGIYDATSKNDLETVGNAQISTTQSKFGGSSMAFDGTGDWLSSPNGQNYNLGSGDFTIECWVYANNLSNLYGIFGKRVDTGVETKWVCSYINTTGTVQTQLSTSGSAWLFNTATTSTITSGSWNHIAWVRYGADFSVYVNGVKNTMTTTLSGSIYTDASALIIGATGTTGAYILSMNGYVDDFRITKGIARYTSNFTPPTTAFLTQ